MWGGAKNEILGPWTKLKQKCMVKSSRWPHQNVSIYNSSKVEILVHFLKFLKSTRYWKEGPWLEASFAMDSARRCPTHDKVEPWLRGLWLHGYWTRRKSRRRCGATQIHLRSPTHDEFWICAGPFGLMDPLCMAALKATIYFQFIFGDKHSLTFVLSS